MADRMRDRYDPHGGAGLSDEDCWGRDRPAGAPPGAWIGSHYISVTSNSGEIVWPLRP